MKKGKGKKRRKRERLRMQRVKTGKEQRSDKLVAELLKEVGREETVEGGVE